VPVLPVVSEGALDALASLSAALSAAARCAAMNAS
jgi:hypothetical protein